MSDMMIKTRQSRPDDEESTIETRYRESMVLFFHYPTHKISLGAIIVNSFELAIDG